MVDRYVKVVLTIIALNLTVIVLHGAFEALTQTAHANVATPVYVEGGSIHIDGGRLDYETDITGGPTLKVCTDC